uniref:G-protein coupled receptors family 1 profile domain-containing protein n=1 Tax=Plectus sambesii TaxID=2011161 RepID=A0A914UJS4_9BILA
MSFAEGLAEADAFPDTFNGTITDSDDTHLTVKYSVYVGLGVLASFACCLPVAAILRHRHLRMKKEYIIVMALTFADFIEAFATTWAGSYRMIGLRNGWAHDSVPIIHCAQFPPVLLWRWSQTSTSFMLLVVSLDRYFAVADPLRYFQYRVSRQKPPLQ